MNTFSIIILIVSTVGLFGLLGTRLVLGGLKNKEGLRRFDDKTINKTCKWYFAILCFVLVAIALICLYYVKVGK